MKKILAWVLVAVFAFGLIACGGSKQPITAEAFRTAAEAAGLKVEDASATYTDKIFTGALLATHSDGWQVVFLTIDTPEHAHEYFGTMKRFIEDQKTGAGSSQIVDNGKYGMYSQTNGGMFAYTFQVGNTLLYVPPVYADSYKETIQAFLKTINY